MVRPQATTGNPHSSHMHGTSTTTNKKTLDRVARRVVIEQELPDPRTALKRAQESLLRQDTATTATNSATSISSCPHDDDAAAAACSHILEFLPLQLNLELAAAATGGWIWQHPVHALHLHSQEERWTGREPPLLYGEEQERAQALQMRGFAGQWVEDKYTDDWKDLHQMEAKAKVLADIKAASEARIAMENQLVAANKIERERMQKEKQASATASTSTAVTTTDQKPAPVEMESQPEKKKPALPSSLSSAATKPSSEAAFDKSTMDPKESKEETKEAAVRNLETKKVEGLVALAKSEAQQGPSKTTEEPLKLQKPASTPGEVGKPPSVPSTSTAQSRALEVNKEENSLPSMSSAAVGPTSSMTSSALSVAASASSRPAVSEMKLSPSFLRPGTATTPGTSVASAASRSQPTIDPPLLDESRFWSLQAKENQIETVRRQFLARRSAPPPKRAKASVAATKKRKSSSVDHKTPSLAHLPAWKEHAPNTPKLSLPEERDWYARQKHVSERVQVWLEQFRWSRELYWQEQQTAFRKAFGSMESTVRTCPQCQNTDGKDDCWFVPTPSTPCTGDDLMQCLECSFVGCAPVTRSGETANHMWQHQLTSNHKFAVTCGPKALVYCFACADFCHHPVFDQERERIDLHHYLPWLAWKEYPLQRSFDAFQFQQIPNQGIVWKGMYATYPSVVPVEHVRGARSCRWRQILFHGEVEELPLTTKRPVLEFAVAQNRLARGDRSRVPAPVGMYNLGNTCFQSAVLQCLIACDPIQKFFLYDVMHHHVACHELRNAEGSTVRGLKASDKSIEVCLACELDKLILHYFGSSRGVDVFSAVTDEENSPKGKPIVRGEPLVTSDMLCCAWKCGSMSHLAGYDQRDAHEFLHGFLDSLSNSDHAYRNRITRAVSLAQPPRAPGTAEKVPPDYRGIVQTLFEGTFRSVLICQQCGNKRSQTESFMSISLPLSKEVQRATLSGMGAQGKKLSVERCLRHFTMPETLADPVDCPSCAKKTLTKKQHVISRLPQVLCLHLKRFDAALNKKIEDFVSFPEKDLNMAPYLPHWAEVPRVAAVEDNKRPKAFNDGFTPDISYNLFGTVNHFGNMQSGHYVSNVQVGDSWFHCNDAHIGHAKAKDVLESEGAYLLFYVRD